MNNPFFSVIIPTYNRAHLIKRTIESILLQDYDNFEVIVVDDGSTDDTESVVLSIKDDRIRFFKKENAERGAARNYGFQKSTGDYINFFDSDDLAYPNHLEVAKGLIEECENPQIFHLNYDFRDENYSPINKKTTPAKNINKQLIEGNVLSCNGVFLRRDIAEKNPFNENRSLSASEDYLLWLQIAAKHQIHSSSIVTSSIVEHDMRSVLTMDIDKLIKRKTLMLEYLFEDESSSKFYSSNKNKMTSNAYSYIALHSVLSKNNNKSYAWKYLIKSISLHPSSLFKKRTFAIIKRLIF